MPDVAAADAHPNDHMAASNLAAAAPRSKANITYSNEMIKYLREVNVDANNVGWYTSANMGNFVNTSLIENQFFYQKEPNERTVALVHDVSRSSQGALSLRAFRLSPSFMAAYKESKFTTEKYGERIRCIETHYTELNNFQYYQRQLAREQTKITAWKTKRAAENASRVQQKQAPLPEDEWERLFKLPTEPSRLEDMLVQDFSNKLDVWRCN
ncbi:putative Eukaryotic translation initiation factor 3 subunit H [Glarea lozoyensis 74030]|uniref:Putative Eukaryotic translation initiation factor 3 subunit H n=1 Tax=Glarea lozoyensis (strain ATCC 74030 / MF5533) TaxID=1104152 RepID=H0EQE1_GLAL7|nr:putative Eukaryotic translation initiation factor 3 subunit H [Glarea lozoyensis 74030]